MRAAERYKSPEDMPRQLAVFPLQGCILLPRVLLPLNVFEPRYLALVDQAMSSTRLIGIIQPVNAGTNGPESPEGSNVPLRQVGCAGRIVSYQELDDGRCLITLLGIARFQRGEEQASTTPFRNCAADFMPFAADLEYGRGEDAVDRSAVIQALKDYVAANRIRADLSVIMRAETELLVNTLSIIAPYGAEEKQALLEAPDLKTRAETLVALAEMDLRASGNGSGSTLQ